MAKAKPITRIESDRLNTPTDLDPADTKKIAEGLAVLTSDLFALYIKTKNFHWHMSGPNFRDYHLLLDEQAEQIFAIVDDVAERARKIGGFALKSLGQAKTLTRVADNDAEYVSPLDMLKELRDDNKALTANMRELHEVTDEANDVSTTSLLEEWINQSEERTWFLYESTRNATDGGH
ncbi:DNA protection during starvation protein [Methylobacterium cerastii]|uniref:DNA protection during starvation protein n=1 Tax=Methylobacterium cerastii TaxID=932741 RepID=A0ABQ4QIA6_9HYPH|nr:MULTISPECIES: DNA starvation/stationary phase protection protein [Methylobacterium]TXM94073.1 DNA starvation/stationary phase protection protein [Methylobacterium sp. WL122]TXM75911.1 DNA starvation/stationary phase protection protein [Methylobacterium sp. WL12]TXM91327.1 DNA starvation/stationary phase protection protein [Methylobacterium sp. WL103]TXN79869.1 DNA starvation/stationary phase protection protein [Methylobacterium sp. WL8]GJD45003.1 DNA protection during starvation protein [Me